MPDVQIIPIADKKLKRRGVSKKMVRETLNSPVQIVEGYGGRKVAHRKYMIEDKECLLRVIYEEKDMQKVVVAASLTSQIERYWEE